MDKSISEKQEEIIFTGQGCSGCVFPGNIMAGIPRKGFFLGQVTALIRIFAHLEYFANKNLFL